MKPNQLKWIYLVVLALIWGSSFMLIKRGLVGLSPLQLGSLRMVFASIFLLSTGFNKLPSIPLYKWKYLAMTAMFGTFIPAFLFAMAQTQIDSSVSSILNSLTPLNTMVIGALFFGLEQKRIQMLGVLIGLIGTLILIFNGAVHHPNQNYYYALLLIIATICYGTNVNLLKKYLSDLSPLAISVGNFCVLLIPASLVLYFSGFFNQIHRVEVLHSTGYIMILGIVGTGVANVIFFKMIQMSSPLFATSVTYLIPVVAFLWGMFDGENLTSVQVLGAAVILFGVYLTGKKQD